VDARLGITTSCKFAGLEYAGNDQTFVDFDPSKARTEKIYWLRCQDGRDRRGYSANDCQSRLDTDEFGLIAMEGVALYIQEPKVVRNHRLLLPGSVCNADAMSVATISFRQGKPGLDWDGRDFTRPLTGPATRGK
jgi:hypothetical protein